MTTKERVLDALKNSKGNYIPGYKLTHPRVGGSEGLRRLRDLRADGYKIEHRRMHNSTAFEYRLRRG